MGTRTLTVIVAASLGLAALSSTYWAATPPTDSPTREDRAIAMGMLIDTPASPDTLDDGLRIADQLRERYQLASGNVRADRVAAAIRARDELVGRLEFTPAEIRAQADVLGYSLEPGRCGNACANIARLARIELEKAALRRFAAGHPSPAT